MSLRILSILTLTCLAAANALAADSPFIGKWKFNPGKSKMTGATIKIENADGGTYKVTFGDDVDTFYLDGKEHPTQYGSVRTVTAEGANKWNTVTKRDGKVTGTGSFTLSEDGQTLTRNYEVNRVDGTVDKQTFKDKRTGGTSGMTGTWENTDGQATADLSLEVKPFEGDGLSFVTPAFGEQDDMKFDGKDYPNVGPRVTPGATTAAKLIDDHHIEMTDKVKGKLIDTAQVELSADGKTMTTTLLNSGEKKTQTYVFERE